MLLLLLALLQTPRADDELACLSVVSRHAIVIRDMVYFEPGTNIMLPPALDLLEAVAEVLSSEQSIDHTVINGHSDPAEGGDHYSLSVERARLVWEALVKAGVPAHRISYRGLGATPAHEAAGAMVSFDVVVVFELDRPVQPSAVDDAAVQQAVQALPVP